MKKLDRYELAWAAGVFDGEGSAYVSDGHTPLLNVAQAGDTHLLLRFRSAVGDLGTLYGPYKRAKAHHKVRWNWMSHSFDQTLTVIGMLWPFLGPVKKDQIKRTLAKYAEWRKSHNQEGWEIIRQCECGRRIQGVAYYKHRRACQVT